jgi:hypothetical protein
MTGGHTNVWHAYVLPPHGQDKEPSYYYEHILIPMGASLQDFIDGKVRKEAYHNAA